MGVVSVAKFHTKHRLYIQSKMKKKLKFKCRYCLYTRHYYRADIQSRLGINTRV